VSCELPSCDKIKWDSWSDWSNCTENCGGGVKRRHRSCFLGEVNRETSLCEQRDEKVKSLRSYVRQKSGLGSDLGQGAVQTSSCNLQKCERKIQSISDLKNDILNGYSDNINSCGFVANQNENQVKPQLRITHGSTSNPGNWPWQASWQHQDCYTKTFKNRRSNKMTRVRECAWSHLCGATLIHQNWVITAGHCIEESGLMIEKSNPGDKWSVVLGMQSLNREEEDQVRVYSDFVEVHPDYDFSVITVADVALVKLSEGISFTEYIQPVCLSSTKTPSHSETCFVSGWGFTTGDKKGGISNELLYGKIPVVGFSECQQTGPWYKLLRPEHHMCAGELAENSVDSCGGDSGGPMVCRLDGVPDRFYLAAVTSFGFTDCGEAGHLGIYAKMMNYVEWVHDAIELDDKVG